MMLQRILQEGSLSKCNLIKSTAHSLKKRKLYCKKAFLTVALIASVSSILYVVFRVVEASPSADIRPFLESYFSTWSAGDLKGYRSHFHKNAHIFYISSRPYRINALDLSSFIDEQNMARMSSSVPMVEKMTDFSANADRKAASVSVQWELHKGGIVTTGVDRFILCREPTGGWKIMALLFYEQEP